MQEFIQKCNTSYKFVKYNWCADVVVVNETSYRHLNPKSRLQHPIRTICGNGGKHDLASHYLFNPTEDAEEVESRELLEVL